jgi:hypothetical protein
LSSGTPLLSIPPILPHQRAGLSRWNAGFTPTPWSSIIRAKQHDCRNQADR